MRASEANSRRLPTRQYQHGSVMPFDGLQPSFFSQDLVALCNYALEQANYTSHAIMQNGDKTAYAVAEEVFNQIFPTGNYHLVVSNTRASYLQILGQKALQSKVKGCNTFVTTIKTRVSDFEHALWITHQDHFKQCIQSQVDYEFMALIKDFDVKLAFHTDEKFHHLAQVQAAAQAEAAAQAKALRSRKARGFQYRPRGFQLTSMQVSQIIATVNTPLTPTGGPTFERFPKLPPELRQMILRFAREYRVIIFSMSSLPPEVEGPPEARRPYLKNNPPMIFKNADESYTTVYATNKDMVCFIEPVPGLKTRATDADIGVPQHVIAPYIPSLNGTPQGTKTNLQIVSMKFSSVLTSLHTGPVRYAQLLTVIALPVHTAYHYYRSGSHSKGEGNWKKTRLMCPALGKMVFICGGNLPGPRTLLADMEIRKLDELWPEEKNSVDNVIFGYARAHSKGLIQSLVFEQVVFNGNSN
jgi:hypothetical protein